MAQIDLNTGASYNDPAADPVKDSFDNIQSNFDELYAAVATTSFDLVPIGTWDMDTDANTSVVYAIPALKRIVGISAVIYSDDGLVVQPIDFENLTTFKSQGNVYYEDGSIYLERLTGGGFDDAAFNGSSNRGYIKVDLMDV
jgi:hypothetical protein